MHKYITQREFEKFGAPGWNPKTYDKHGDAYLGTIGGIDYLDAEMRGVESKEHNL